MPANIEGFSLPLQGVAGFVIPATQHDLWLWVAGHAYERVFDATCEAIAALDVYTVFADETDGWTYKDNIHIRGAQGRMDSSLGDIVGLIARESASPQPGAEVLLKRLTELLYIKSSDSGLTRKPKHRWAGSAHCGTSPSARRSD